MGLNSDVVQWKIYVGTEDEWAKEIRWDGCESGCGENSNEIMCSIKYKENWMSSWAPVSFSGRTILCDIECYSL